jgi:hypothetical protein
MVFSPKLQDGDLVEKGIGAILMVGVPDLLSDFWEDRREPFGAVTNLEEGVQEAKNHNNAREQSLA